MNKATLLAAAFAVTFLLAAQAPKATVPAATDPASDTEPLNLKSYGCNQHLELLDTEDGRSDIVTVWAHGYYNGMRGVDEATDTADWITVEKFSEDLVRACEANPERLFISAVKDLAQNPAAKEGH